MPVLGEVRDDLSLLLAADKRGELLQELPTGRLAEVAIQRQCVPHGARRRERLLYGTLHTLGAHEPDGVLQVAGHAQALCEPIHRLRRVPRQHLQVVSGAPIDRGDGLDVDVEVLRGLPRRGVGDLPELPLGHDGGQVRLEVPLPQDVRAADLHQGVYRQLLGVLLHLRAELQRGHHALRGLLLVLLAGVRALLAARLEEGGPQAVLLPLLEILLDVLVVVTDAQLVDALTSDAL
mmetsp:Transcript_115879/g.324086  ORF Transcript_115879/g.324086 Transcript_115879/m.324086 type:complete len:235 (-) Transcript_115879:539-1243(-)